MRLFRIFRAEMRKFEKKYELKECVKLGAALGVIIALAPSVTAPWRRRFKEMYDQHTR